MDYRIEGFMVRPGKTRRSVDTGARGVKATESRACGMTMRGGLRRGAMVGLIILAPLAGRAQDLTQMAPIAASQPAPAIVLTPFAQALAQAIGNDSALQEFYRATNYQPIWTTAEDAARRQAFLDALAGAETQGLPAPRYDRDGLIAKLTAAQTERDRAQAEVAMSRSFLQYARDAASGVVVPSEVDPTIVRAVTRPNRLETLKSFAAAADPAAYLAGLLPTAPEYNALLKQKLTLERLVATDAWGPTVAAKVLKPGQSGDAVVALRNRLIAMGYLAASADQSYDEDMQAAVMQFQSDHGIEPDGVAGPGTMAEINVQPQGRLESVIVAMERWRWMPRDLGRKHVWVNLADFSAKVYVDDKMVFETPAIVGKPGKDFRTPEFSDVMRYMDVNPTWNVPKSIVAKEYLPALQQDPTADGQLQLIDQSGRVVDRSTVDFTQYDASNFPFDLKQPPSDGNALGLVKFMFPNKYNIYLHDTPTKYLFKREVRAFSHGCIRLQRPFDLAYTLLGWQTDDPQAVFKAALARRVENVIDLKEPLPVHLVYFTAITSLTGQMQYRRDIYGRDALIFAALVKAGVAPGPLTN